MYKEGTGVGDRRSLRENRKCWWEWRDRRFPFKDAAYARFFLYGLLRNYISSKRSLVVIS